MVLNTSVIFALGILRDSTRSLRKKPLSSQQKTVTFQGEFVFLLDWHSMHE